jgi:tellurite resistance protein TehA-like permease
VRIRLADVEPTPDVFAAVMATGILSIAAGKHHYAEISEFLGSLAEVGLVVLIALAFMTGAAKRWDLTDPDVTIRLFTFVTACAVLDSRLTTPRVVVVTLGVVALLSWLVLIGFTARDMTARAWPALRDRAHGTWELASVGTSGLAIVAAKVAHYTSERWLLAVAVPVWVAALCIYGLMTWLILWRTIAERQNFAGFDPDSWILMGGLAIATLAGDNIHRLAPPWLGRPVLAVAVVTWVVATLWIPPLIYFGLHRISQGPGRLCFGGIWWALVFPLGMYSAATYAMATELSQRSLITVSLVFFWDALAAWLIVLVAGLRRMWRVLAGEPTG